MKAFASYVSYVVLMVQRVTREQQRKWGLLHADNLNKKPIGEALPKAHLSMAPEEAAWGRVDVHQRGIVGLALDLAADLDNAEEFEHVVADIETGVPSACHRIPVAVGDLSREIAVGGTGDGDGDLDPADVDSMVVGDGDEVDCETSMYRRNRIVARGGVERGEQQPGKGWGGACARACSW